MLIKLAKCRNQISIFLSTTYRISSSDEFHHSKKFEWQIKKRSVLSTHELWMFHLYSGDKVKWKQEKVNRTITINEKLKKKTKTKIHAVNTEKLRVFASCAHTWLSLANDLSEITSNISTRTQRKNESCLPMRISSFRTLSFSIQTSKSFQYQAVWRRQPKNKNKQPNEQWVYDWCSCNSRMPSIACEINAHTPTIPPTQLYSCKRKTRVRTHFSLGRYSTLKRNASMSMLYSAQPQIHSQYQRSGDIVRF